MRVEGSRGRDEHFGISSFFSVKKARRICHWLGMISVCMCAFAYAQGAEVGPCG